MDQAHGVAHTGLLSAVLAAEPFPRPIVAFSPPATIGQSAEPIEPRRRSWAADVECAEYYVGTERRPMIVADHSDGHFPAALGERTLQLFYAADTAIVVCPGWAMLSALQLYERALFAIGGVKEKAAIRASTNLLLSVVNHLAREGVSRRLSDRVGDGAEAVQDQPDADRVAASNSDQRSAAFEEPVFEAHGSSFQSLAEEIGFVFPGDRAGDSGGPVEVASGAAGIAAFGPYAPLEEGQYRYIVEAEAAEGPVRLQVEAVCDQGNLILARHAYSFPEDARRIAAHLDFAVVPMASLQPVELRLWTEEGAQPFRLTRFKLVQLT
jgi:hypothetical protein